MSITDYVVNVAQMKNEQNLKAQVEVSVLKKAMQIQQEMVKQMMETMQVANGGTQPTPPPNPDGTISLYA